jgi:hypothetical protein
LVANGQLDPHQHALRLAGSRGILTGD